jgi:ParB-like chromosome segregation protein Spo0J
VAARKSGVNKLIGFELSILNIPIESIIVTRALTPRIESTKKYLQVRASIIAVGVIEPLSVAKPTKKLERYVLLDGHLRLLAMKNLGMKSVPCLTSLDDEGFTYNNRINRLSTIQEHAMLVNALKRGVSGEALAKALNVDVRVIERRADMFKGICQEAIELLRDRIFSYDVTRALRKMKPLRQVEAVELMVSANSLTIGYAEALLAATPENKLVAEVRAKMGGLTSEQMAKMENEMTNVQEQFKLVEQTYGQDVLNMVLAKGYLNKLLTNKQTSRFLKQRYKELHTELEELARIVNLDE